MHCYCNWEKSGTQCGKWNMINCSSEPILTVIEINLFLNFKSNSKSIRKKPESMWWAAEQTAWFKQQRAYQAHAWVRQAQDRQQLIRLIGGGCRTQGSTLRIQATSLEQGFWGLESRIPPLPLSPHQLCTGKERWAGFQGFGQEENGVTLLPSLFVLLSDIDKSQYLQGFY